MKSFTTTDVDVFADMIEKAVKAGLTFEAQDDGGQYTIIYTGGF